MHHMDQMPQGGFKINGKDVTLTTEELKAAHLVAGEVEFNIEPLQMIRHIVRLQDELRQSREDVNSYHATIVRILGDLKQYDVLTSATIRSTSHLQLINDKVVGWGRTAIDEMFADVFKALATRLEELIELAKKRSRPSENAMEKIAQLITEHTPAALDVTRDEQASLRYDTIIDVVSVALSQRDEFREKLKIETDLTLKMKSFMSQFDILLKRHTVEVTGSDQLDPMNQLIALDDYIVGLEHRQDEHTAFIASLHSIMNAWQMFGDMREPLTKDSQYIDILEQHLEYIDRQFRSVVSSSIQSNQRQAILEHIITGAKNSLPEFLTVQQLSEGMVGVTASEEDLAAVNLAFQVLWQEVRKILDAKKPIKTKK